MPPITDSNSVDISSPLIHVTADLEGLLTSEARVVRCAIGQSATITPPPLPPSFLSLPDPVSKAFLLDARVPSPAVYALKDAVTFFRMALSLDGQLVIGSDYSPSFYSGLTDNLMDGLARQPLPRGRRLISEPVYLPWLWKYHEYGHFLVEMLPRVLLIKELYSRGLRFPVLVPAACGLLHEALATFAPELIVLPVDDYGTEIHLKHCLIPVDGSLEHAYHPDGALRINAAVSEMREVAGRTPQKRNRGTFLSRIEFRAKQGRDFRLLANEHQLHDVARAAGLEVVEPQALTLRDQALLMNDSALIVGEASSALHNAIFARGARVISLGWINHVQTMIAGLQSHILTYLLPESGPKIVSDYSAIPFGDMDDERRFNIDPSVFERVLLDELQFIDA